MRNFRVWLICGTLVGVMLAGRAAAHEGQPLRTINVRVGQYPLVVNYYNAPRGGQALAFSIAPVEPTAGGLTYRVTAEPGMTIEAVPVKARLEPDPDRPNGVSGTVHLPVTGQWLLHIEVDGPRGSSYESVPVLAGLPPVLPGWIGWLIGLIPVWAILGFIGWQARPRARMQHGQVSTIP